MSESTSSVEPIEGQLWTHIEHGHTVVTTRVTESHVHYEFWTDEPTQHADAARDFIEEKFDHSLAYIAPKGGSCRPPEEFIQDFKYQQERPRNTYETDSATSGSNPDADNGSKSE